MRNGDGLRVVLWLAGCSHCCKGCQNPVTWDPNDGIPFDDKAKQEIFNQLDKPYISGITFSGGDPLYCSNKEEVGLFMKEIKGKYPDKTIWMYTGDMWETCLSYKYLEYVDVLIDGEFILEQRDVKLLWKGSKNQRVIDVKASLKNKDKEPVLHCGDYSAETYAVLKEPDCCG